MLTDDHAFVELVARIDEQTAAFLNLPERIGHCGTVVLRNNHAGATLADITRLDRPVVVKDVTHDARAAAHRHEHALEADQTASRDAVFQTHAALAVGFHVLKVTAATAEFFHHGTLMLFFNVDRQEFIRLHLDAVDFLDNNARAGNGQFIAFAAHVFEQNRKMQFTAAGDFPNGLVGGRTHTHCNVGLQFAFETFANLTRSDELAFTAGERRSVHLEVHRKGRFVNREHRKRFRMILVGDRRADIEFFNTGHEDNVTGLSFVDFLAFKPFELKNLIDLGAAGRTIRTVHDGHFGVRIDAAAVHAADADFAHIGRVIERADLQHQRTVGIVVANRNVLDNRVKDRTHVADLLELFDVVSRAGIAVERRGVDHREVELIFRRAELVEQIECLVKDPVRTSARAVDFIDNDNGLKPLCECLAGNEARLRHRAFNGINEQQYAVDHREDALDLAAEVGVTRGVNDVNVHPFIFNCAVLGQNGDAALAFDRVGVHHALFNLLVGAEGARTLKKTVDHRGLAVVDVGDDRNIADSSSHGNLMLKVLIKMDQCSTVTSRSGSSTPRSPTRAVPRRPRRGP